MSFSDKLSFSCKCTCGRIPGLLDYNSSRATEQRCHSTCCLYHQAEIGKKECSSVLMLCLLYRRQNARKQEKEMYEMARTTRQEDAGAGRSGNRADKPVSRVAVAMVC